MKKHVQTTHPVLAIAKAMRDAQRIATKARKLEERLRAYELPDVSTALLAETIAGYATTLGRQLNEVPPNWKPRKGSVGKPLGVGDRVRLTAEAAKRFAGIATVRDVFAIQSVVGSRLLCRRETGDPVVLPLTRSSVQREP